MRRRLSALSSFYRYCAAHDLVARIPTAGVARPVVNPDYTATVGLARDEARALVAAADADRGRHALRTAAVVRLLLHNALRVDEACAADVADLGADAGHRAHDLGINFFDTANRYGGAFSPPGQAAGNDRSHPGWNEEIIGDWFASGQPHKRRVCAGRGRSGYVVLDANRHGLLPSRTERGQRGRAKRLAGVDVRGVGSGVDAGAA